MVKEIIFGIVGVLVLFIYGIWEMSEGLHKASGERMRKILHNLTGSPLKGVLVGTGITSIIQSSSATTVMVVGFVFVEVLVLLIISILKYHREQIELFFDDLMMF